MAPPALSFIMGTALAFHTRKFSVVSWGEELLFFCCIFLLLSAIFLYFSYHHDQLLFPFISIIILFLSMGYLITRHEFHQFTLQSEHLATMPIKEGQITKVDHFSGMDRIQVKVNDQKYPRRAHHFLILLLDKDHELVPGMKIRISEPLNKIEKSKVPFQFDPYTYWKYQHTSHQIFIRHAGDIQIIDASPPPFFYQIHRYLIEKTNQRYSKPDQAGLIKALLLGNKSGISAEDKSYFKNAGMLHILAVSGLHVGIISLVFHILLYPIRFFLSDSKIHWIIMIGLIWCYAAITGLNTPVIRASILATFFIISRIVNRRGRSWNLYFWALLFVLVADPFSLFTVSFQLSFGAVASILLFYQPVRRKITKITGAHYLIDLAAVSISAQLYLIPLLIYHFNEISTLGLISSILVIPLLLPVILSAFISLILPADFFFTGWINKISGFLIDLIQIISSFLGNWSYSNQILVWHSWTIAAITLTITGLVLILQQDNLRIRKWGMLLIFLSFFSALFTEGYNIFRQRQQKIAAIHTNAGIPLIDIYHKGICYTNTLQPSEPEIIKSRKKYYIKHVINPFEEDEWIALIRRIKEHSNQGTKDYIHLSITSPVNRSPDENLRPKLSKNHKMMIP